MPVRKWVKRGLWSLALIVGGWACWRFWPQSVPKLAISKETTYVSEPRDENGADDYLGAINQRLSRGITRENNAAIVILENLWVERPDNIEKATFERLGVPLPKTRRGKFLHLSDFLGNRDSRLIDEQYRAARSRPWTKREFPRIATWLERIREPLDRIRNGLQRSQMYYPVLSDGDSIDVRYAQLNRFISAAFEIRAWQQLSATSLRRISSGT